MMASKRLGRLVCLVFLGSFFAVSARALNFVVTTIADGNNGACTVALCTLRDAVIAANANVGADTITLPPGTYTLSIAGSGENASTTGDLDIAAGGLAIIGAGSATTIIDGGAIDRVIHILGGPVTINDVTIRNGRIAGGGGIFIESATAVVGLTRVVVTGNNGLTAGGGGIRNGGVLTLTDSTVSNNITSNQQGAGIFTSGATTISGSTISGNNTNGDQGGGIFLINANMTITNSTISGNNASGDTGGGIFANPPLSGSNTLTLTNTTITGNTADSGGGIFTFSPGVFTMTGTIVAGNTATSSPDCNGAVSSGGFNLIQNTTGCTITGTTTGNITGQSAQLAPLANNGGPTQTHALMGTSPALNAQTSGCPPPTFDQRGVMRPQQTACEMGAFECQPGECGGGVAPTATATNTPAGVATATPTVAAPTATRTNTPSGGGPTAVVPTLSFPILALLGLALAGVALFLIKRP